MSLWFGMSRGRDFTRSGCGIESRSLTQLPCSDFGTDGCSNGLPEAVARAISRAPSSPKRASIEFLRVVISRLTS